MIDSSAWIDFLRGAKGGQRERVRQLISSSDDVTTDPVILEVVGGGRSSAEVETLVGLLGHAEYVAQVPHADVFEAVELYQTCRAAGETIRALNDCLIAAIALRADLPVLHNDRDFDVLARHTGLKAIRA